MKKYLAPIAGIVVLSLAACAWWQNREGQDSAALQLHGNVDIRQISLAFDGSGRIAELRAEEGDHVRAGQLLARLDTRTLALQAAQAQAQIEVQQQTLLRLQNGSRPQEITQVRSRLAAAQADADRTRRDFERLEGIVRSSDGKAVSTEDLDRAKSAAQVAAATQEEQRAALQLAELGPRKEEVQGATAQLAASRAQLALLQHQIAMGDLLAPADAVVRSRLQEAGDMVTAQRPVLSLALLHPKWIRAYVGESDLGRVREGMAASVVTDSHPTRPIPGKVGYISSVAEFTPKSVQTDALRSSLVYEVRILVDDGADVLRLGQPAVVTLASGGVK